MQHELKITPTEFTPEISFNAQSGVMSIQGRSMPEDIAGFFDPIALWLKEYMENPAENTNFRIYFEYYNSSTARRLTELIFDLEKIRSQGKHVKITWCYKSGDFIMKENGEEIGSVIDLPFELQEI
jgi:hypothetical protein